MQSAKEVLHQFWGYSSFRGEQASIIESVINGKDTLALLPTSGGKSICFQVPALMKEGICLVISPLIALMRDQVENLNKKNIPALYISSGMSLYEVHETFNKATTGYYKLLYLSPERLESNLFKEYIQHLTISFIAIDEAHCISQWGYDFRPSYLNIANLRKQLPNIPIIALTASATIIVQEDIIKQLHFTNYQVFHQSFERKNLSYSVFKVESKINKLIAILQSVPGPSIVYCRSRKQSNNVCTLLQLQNISADFYHAGLHYNERNKKQQDWMNNTTRVIVCTNAFGMGIDKPDVRTVIHFDTPDCIENYYQEAGRAGRDGKKAYAILLYQTEDEKYLNNIVEERFPDIADIRQTYQSLADYLQIPIGIGAGNYYDFNLIDFTQKFQISIQQVIAVLKVLEQEGYVSFTEDIFLPSQVQFTTSKIILNDVEKTHPELDAVIKCLLRTYSGIYDNRVSINEKQIAKLCKLSYEKVYSHLQQLKSLGIIDYLRHKETPQINLLTNRASASSLEINYKRYFERKQQYLQRVNAMINYLHISTCRNELIAKYFGENSTSACGICDCCLQQKSKPTSLQNFTEIIQQIWQSIPANGITVHQLIQLNHSIKKDTFWKAVEFLESEGKIVHRESVIIKIK